MTDSYYMGSSCRGSIRSCDFQSSNNSVASPVSARNALLSISSINALVTDRELFTTATSVVPKLRAIVEHRKECSRSSNMWQMTPPERQYPPCWVVKKKHHGAEISEFDRSKLPSAPSIGGPNWFRGNARATDSRHSMIESRGSIHTRDAYLTEHTHSEVRAKQLLEWPRNDNNITYAVSAQVTVSCRLDEAMTMLFSRDILQFDASMASLFGARKYKSGDLLVSREFHKSLQTALAMDVGDDNFTCWDDDDLNDLSQSGWVALQTVVLRSRRSLNPMAAAKHTSRRQRLCFAAYSQYCPDSNEAFYTMKTLPKPMHDKFTRRSNERASEQAIRGDLDHIGAGYHLMSSYSDLSGHQTRVVMTAYVSSPPSAANASQPRSRFWGPMHHGGSVRHYAPPSANAEAKYVVNLLAAATTSFEQLVRRRRLGYQPFLPVSVIHDTERDKRCSVCLKTFGLLRPQRFCQLCAQRVCRECSRKFDVEPVARRVRRNRICFACVANVDASVFQQENPLLNATLPRVSTAATTGRNNADSTQDEGETDDAKISTAFYDILLKPNDTRKSQSRNAATASQTAYEVQMHRLDRSSSAATASASFSSTPGRQLADALFSSNPLTRARALEIVRQVVKQVTSDSAPTSSTSTSSTSTCNSSVPVFHPQYPDRKMVDKYLEARLQLSSISLSGKPTSADNSNIRRSRSSSLYNLEEVKHRRRRSTSGQCFSSSAKFDMNTRPSIVPRPWTTTANLETELDLDDDLDSAALDSICEVAAIRMRCSIAYIVALNGAHNAQTQRVVGSSGAPRPWTEDVTVCPFPLVANAKPFVIKDPMRDPQLRHLRLVRDIGVRFFAGFPIKAPDGSVVACLCTVDAKAREKISLEDLKAMHALSKLASDLFEEEVNPFTPRSIHQ
ncbi:hypothetical protein PHMEG_0002536 [Phytophthora megakarya]|uniref:FYVE-type domain-containing protein n=1 Tax=Phytophthora megakarya TaxID=4795 RepID=A0A225WYW1_9STRA|nr:hypothetical protein PHMEG_0002536 [Phytophthora megakarya]